MHFARAPLPVRERKTFENKSQSVPPCLSVSRKNPLTIAAPQLDMRVASASHCSQSTRVPGANAKEPNLSSSGKFVSRSHQKLIPTLLMICEISPSNREPADAHIIAAKFHKNKKHVINGCIRVLPLTNNSCPPQMFMLRLEPPPPSTIFEKNLALFPPVCKSAKPWLSELGTDVATTN